MPEGGLRWITASEVNTDLVIHTVTVTLTDAQIKTLPTISVEVLPAPGANKIILLFGGYFVLDSRGGSYTNIANASWQFGFDYNKFWSSTTLVQTILGGNPDIYIMQIAGTALQTGTGDFAGEVLVAQSTVQLDVNTPLFLRDIYDGVTNYTGGNAANLLKVNLYYAIVDL